jgi:hypothetical protein
MTMADERNFIEQTLTRSELVTGREMLPSELSAEFSKLGPTERVDHLTRIRGDLEGVNLSLNEATRLHAYHRGLKSTHERLRKIDR